MWGWVNAWGGWWGCVVASANLIIEVLVAVFTFTGALFWRRSFPPAATQRVRLVDDEELIKVTVVVHAATTQLHTQTAHIRANPSDPKRTHMAPACSSMQAGC